MEQSKELEKVVGTEQEGIIKCLEAFDEIEEIVTASNAGTIGCCL